MSLKGFCDCLAKISSCCSTIFCCDFWKSVCTKIKNCDCCHKKTKSVSQNKTQKQGKKTLTIKPKSVVQTVQANPPEWDKEQDERMRKEAEEFHENQKRLERQILQNKIQYLHSQAGMMKEQMDAMEVQMHIHSPTYLSTAQSHGSSHLGSPNTRRSVEGHAEDPREQTSPVMQSANEMIPQWKIFVDGSAVPMSFTSAENESRDQALPDLPINSGVNKGQITHLKVAPPVKPQGRRGPLNKQDSPPSPDYRSRTLHTQRSRQAP